MCRPPFRVGPIAAVAVLALCGCIRDRVEVTVEPRPDGSFVRTLGLWRFDDGEKDKIQAPSEEILANAAKHYMDRLPGDGPAVRFRGTFYTVPTDVLYEGRTNRGAYTVLRSPLGRLAYYRERRPGRLDLRANLAEVERGLDLVVKLLATVARQQLEGEEGLDRLVADLQGPLLRDLKELAFLFYVARLGPAGRVKEHRKADEKRLLNAAALALQLAEERGLLKAADIPKLAADDDARTEVLQRLVAARMGRKLDVALRTRLALLGDKDRLEAAAKQALKALGHTEEEFQELLKPLGHSVLAFEIFEDFAELQLTLKLPPGAEVRATSGRHDEKNHQIVWDSALRDRPVGHLFFALWSAPDAAWQTKHLGRAVLRGQPLEEYLAWEGVLDDARRKAWHAALDALDPKTGLAKQLEAIRLTPLPPGAEPAPEKGASLILGALKAGEEE